MPSHDSDKEIQLVRRILAGNRDEYRVIVHQYQDAVFRLCFNLVGDCHHAEDIAQEAFVAAFRALESFDPAKARLKTWLLTIARNRGVNHLKRRQLVTSNSIVDDQQTVNTSLDADRKELWEQLDQALMELPVEQKTVFVLAEIEQLTYAEIAAIENASLGTIKSRLHRAKQKLQVLLSASMHKG